MKYCTGWFDGWPTWLGGNGREWSHCCKAHDEFYASYDGWSGYLGAHWDLAVCVGQVNWGMAVVMLGGLLTFGTGLIIHKKNQYKGKDHNR